ncbi:hypothetical protein F01_50127 [Burkholderia cenocepacia]|nr:hypothetical protein F01_50127 [Burkholderia cenocepacia]
MVSFQVSAPAAGADRSVEVVRGATFPVDGWQFGRGFSITPYVRRTFEGVAGGRAQGVEIPDHAQAAPHRAQVDVGEGRAHRISAERWASGRACRRRRPNDSPTRSRAGGRCRRTRADRCRRATVRAGIRGACRATGKSDRTESRRR